MVLKIWIQTRKKTARLKTGKLSRNVNLNLNLKAQFYTWAISHAT